MMIGTALRPRRGETACGDAIAVEDDGDYTLIALVDGLGHGVEAEAAAQTACRVIHMSRHLELCALMRHVDRSLGGTRGAAIMAARIDARDHSVSCGGVGNVELTSACATPFHALSTPGIVGRRFRKMRVFEARLQAGDRLVMFSDGVSSRLELQVFAGMDARTAAHSILARHGKHSDDASCIVVDYE